MKNSGYSISAEIPNKQACSLVWLRRKVVQLEYTTKHRLPTVIKKPPCNIEGPSQWLGQSLSITSIGKLPDHLKNNPELKKGNRIMRGSMLVIASMQ